MSENRKSLRIDEVPTQWLCSVLKLLNEMAGEGITIDDCEDPAELMCEIAGYLGCSESDDPWEASMLKLRPCLSG
jgi:hypothetical protein